ncbi:hypothetical protein BTN98_12990 [Photobacterium aquimaris]|nr:hypothetical protein BTN98_12990 [Photobacterium aquimaris]
MEVALKLSVIVIDAINKYKDDLELFLSSVFNVGCHVAINSEFRCAVVIEHSGRICACGFGYERKMYQNQIYFKGGIVGGIAVSSPLQFIILISSKVNGVNLFIGGVWLNRTHLYSYQKSWL